MRITITVTPDGEGGPAVIAGDPEPLRDALQDHFDECPLPPDAYCLPCHLWNLARRAMDGEWRPSRPSARERLAEMRATGVGPTPLPSPPVELIRERPPWAQRETGGDGDYTARTLPR
jgi:hypothetical protein